MGIRKFSSTPAYKGFSLPALGNISTWQPIPGEHCCWHPSESSRASSNTWHNVPHTLPCTRSTLSLSWTCTTPATAAAAATDNGHASPRPNHAGTHRTELHTRRPCSRYTRQCRRTLHSPLSRKVYRVRRRLYLPE